MSLELSVSQRMALKELLDYVEDNVLCSMILLQTEILDEDKRLVSAVDYYFIQDDGSRFKVSP